MMALLKTKTTKNKRVIYIVTGVSRGIGKAIAENYLSQGFKVIGVGRRHSIEHANFSFEKCDLSNLESAGQLFANQKFEEPVTLINNAGIMGSIKRISEQENLDLELVMAVNATSPMLLTKNIYGNMSNKADFTLVNISSGAANRAIPSWASYCASKAALNMLTEVFYLEELEKGIDLKAYAVSPGVIETGMQEQIRNAPKEQFSAVDNFKKMKEEGVLFSAEEAASKLVVLLYSDFTGEIKHDLRNVNS
ncbi:MAG: benzil reductase ((S)-benzoin forming) [Salibacteraceae bacterium]|jgi:benzil reductase ((S)-benzoin forming)